MNNEEDYHQGIHFFNKRNYVTREQWGARKCTIKKVLKTPVPYVVFTYTHTLPCETKRQCIDRVSTQQACAMANCKLSDIRAK